MNQDLDMMIFLLYLVFAMQPPEYLMMFVDVVDAEMCYRKLIKFFLNGKTVFCIELTKEHENTYIIV